MINTDWQAALDIINEWIWLLLPLFLLQTALMVFALVSVVRKDVTGTEKLPWIILIILVNIFGPIIYFAVGSSQLDEKIARREDRE